MTRCLFFCGRGESQALAVRHALEQCNDVLLDFPSLVIELVELEHNASNYNAHLRVMAISSSVDTQTYKKHPYPHPELAVKPNDDLGRREGVEEHKVKIFGDHEKDQPLESFDHAVTFGIIPDLPTQDFDQFKGLGMGVEEVRNYLTNRQMLLQQQMKIDTI